MLTCYACGHRADAGQRCECGEPLWFETAAGADGEGAAVEWPDRDGVWAFAALLPVDPPAAGLSGAAGGTPLVRAPGLDAGGVRVHVKLEGTNPTGSFKDRGSAVGVAGAVAAGADAVGTVSHGNMAASMAAHAASAGLDCVVLVPADVPAARLDRIAAYGPRILRVDGDYGRLYHDALALGPGAGVEFVNSDSPLRVAGQKTTVLEILRAFAAGEAGGGDGPNGGEGESNGGEGESNGGERESNDGGDTRAGGVHASGVPDAPDAVVMPVSSGGHASAAWKAVRDATAAGLLAAEDVPRLHLVQAEACSPVADAFERGDDETTRLSADEVDETVAYSIANPDPPSGTRALAAVRDTGGSALSVDDDAIRDARRRLARAGFRVEAASATTLAGLDRLRERGAVERGEHVALVATGVGYGGGADASDAETVTRAGLPAALGVE